jgi:membrane-bound lytic murein transglycosylase B
LLARLQQEYGVPPEYLVAFWGLETNFGNYFGDIPTLDALATLACDARRSRMFSRQLIDAVAMVDEGRLDLADLRGSWAGAMGHTQFMPTTMRHYAVDYDRDGRIDLWRSLPDALASAANYLGRMGWRPTESWGEEVVVTDLGALEDAGYKASKPVAQWTALGVRRIDGSVLPDRPEAISLLAPGGRTGPAFVTYPNFRVIMRWNACQGTPRDPLSARRGPRNPGTTQDAGLSHRARGRRAGRGKPGGHAPLRAGCQAHDRWGARSGASGGVAGGNRRE